MNLWHRLGVSVAIVAAFYIIVTEAFQDKTYYENYRWHICGSFIGLGIALWIIGRIVNKRRQSPPPDREGAVSADDPEETPESREPFLFLNVAYWGAMLVVFGLIITIVVPRREAKPKPVAARTNSVARVTRIATNPPPQPVAFPTFKLQGVVYRQPDPSVLINGRTFFVGESVEGAKIIAIEPHSATFEWKGERVVLRTPD